MSQLTETHPRPPEAPEPVPVTVNLPGEAHSFFTCNLEWGAGDFEDLFLDALWSVLDLEFPTWPRALDVKDALRRAQEKALGGGRL